MKNITVLLLARLLCLPLLTRADTTWVAAGNVSGVWGSSGSPYIVHTGDITVAANDTLLIQPGVRVFFTGNYKLLVNGLLQAVGTEADSIWFTGDPTSFPYDSPTRWRGLRFVNAHEDCQLYYCSISYSGVTGPGELSYGGGVYCYNTDLLVEHSRVHHCHAGRYPPYYPGRGCGMYVEQSDVVLSYTDITNNIATIDFDGPVPSYGGGLYLVGGSAHLRNCKVQANSADLAVGGIYVRAAATVTLDTCVIADNEAIDGSYTGMVFDSGAVISMTGTTIANHDPYVGYNAGITCGQVTLAMDACTLRNNSASWVGPQEWTGGAALYIQNPVYARISNTVFENNDGQYGAAILCNNTEITNCMFRQNNSSNGALYSNGGNKIRDCLFENNTARGFGPVLAYYGDAQGGAIWFRSGADSVSACKFIGNYAVRYWEEWNGVEYVIDTLSTRGGALFCEQNASPYIVNCVFENNDMNRNGLFGTGSVLYNEGGHPTFEFCTMNNNNASGGHYEGNEYGNFDEPGGVIYSEGGLVTLKSCIMSNSVASTGVWFANSTVGNIEFSDFYGISGGNFAGTIPAGLGTVSTTNENGDPCDDFFNIYLDPQYVDAPNGDLHLSDTSPCIGAADPNSVVAEDYEHGARPQAPGSVADIGAYESAIGGALAPVIDLVIFPDLDNGDILLSWTASQGAASYDIYAGDAPEYDPENFMLIGTTTATAYTDEDVLLSSEQRTYLVVAVP